MRVALFGVLVLLGLNAGINLTLDATGLWPRAHTSLEILTAVIGMLAAGALWWGWRRSAASEAAALRSLEERRQERDAWRESARRAMEGFGNAIDAQFDLWELTPTEREIALLLLKGYSHKRIADLTGRRERTVRQHGVVIYHKSGLAGRAELAAYFLEDLVLPGAASSTRHAPDR
jgi:DNA-binding NarL/FixJ family response regulator